ncbi:MAG: gluconate 2-dehydrogenase subunit 3 family protein [Acidobacteriaceae bacterium]
MERRAVLKIVALTALSQKLNALPGASMEHMQAPPAAPPATAYTQRFFTEEESRLLDQVMEMIIPADAHSPGAHEAQTNLFADLMVALSAAAVQQQWRDGIRMIREESEHSSLADALHKASLNEEDPKSDLDRFFVVLKQMTVDGYYTSAIGIHKDMGYIGNAYLGAFPGCSHPEHEKG